jgi:hypothetical protein
MPRHGIAGVDGYLTRDLHTIMTTAPQPLPTPELVFVADLTVTVAQPSEAGMVQGLNSRGRRRIIPITGGTPICKAASCPAAPTSRSSCPRPVPIWMRAT